jgi:hypothetical protein
VLLVRSGSRLGEAIFHDSTSTFVCENSFSNHWCGSVASVTKLPAEQLWERSQTCQNSERASPPQATSAEVPNGLQKTTRARKCFHPLLSWASWKNLLPPRLLQLVLMLPTLALEGPTARIGGGSTSELDGGNIVWWWSSSMASMAPIGSGQTKAEAKGRTASQIWEEWHELFVWLVLICCERKVLLAGGW